jgi:hypothetical protein
VFLYAMSYKSDKSALKRLNAYNMKQTAIQQAINIVRSRIDSMDETLMGKHTIHHLQQVERLLYELIEAEKQQITKAYNSAIPFKFGEQYYNETYGKDA